MPSQVISSIENNFTKGLVTEFTGLNFPENAATDADNCSFSIVGDTSRRLGMDFEENYQSLVSDRSGAGMSQYKWNNVGGDGLTQVVVEQIGDTVYFYLSSVATVDHPVSTTSGAIAPLNIRQFTTVAAFDLTLECQYADGNGYLIIYHPSCDAIVCTYDTGRITAVSTPVLIRDFAGVPETISVNARPKTLSSGHKYNLTNQGWTSGAPWQDNSFSVNTVSVGAKVFTVAAGLPIVSGDLVSFSNAHAVSPGGTFSPAGTPIMAGSVSSYAGTTLNVNIFTTTGDPWIGASYGDWLLTPNNYGFIDTWFTALTNYPSNADVWWRFKDNSDVFSPGTTAANVSIDTGPAPKGHYILNAFDQQFSVISGIDGLTPITTTKRPRTGTWYAGRAWYTGVDSQQASSLSAGGTAGYYTWTENIYFSQIVTTVEDIGKCYQTNSPTSESLFDLLPTDGGVITIQGSGSIFKLFPIQNGMLVFAANGIWFITGSQGIGFTANDYTITKISSVQSISSTSFVNVQGLPFFWNEEGIYTVEPSKGGGLEVNPITVGTILTFYEAIPLSCKKFARGDYNPIDYVIQWVYRDAEAGSSTDNYSFTNILNFNTYNKAFYPYNIVNGGSGNDPYVNNVLYLVGPGGSTSPPPTFKYFCSSVLGISYSFTFAELRDEDYKDWTSWDTVGFNFNSYFITGFKLHGQGQRRFQIPYIYVFSRNDEPSAYKIQGIWDYASSGNSGRWSTNQLVTNFNPNYAMLFRRHRIRGQGLVLQIKISSADGEPFNIMGWSTFETQNTGV